MTYNKVWESHRKKYQIKKTIRMNKEDIEELEAKRKKSGLNLQEYMVKCLKQHKINVYNIDTKEIVNLCRNMANNINQIAKIANTTGYIDLKQFDNAIKEISKIIQHLNVLDKNIKELQRKE